LDYRLALSDSLAEKWPFSPEIDALARNRPLFLCIGKLGPFFPYSLKKSAFPARILGICPNYGKIFIIFSPAQYWADHYDMLPDIDYFLAPFPKKLFLAIIGTFMRYY